MLHIEQLEDGCYHITLEYSVDGFGFRYEWTFRECERCSARRKRSENSSQDRLTAGLW